MSDDFIQPLVSPEEAAAFHDPPEVIGKFPSRDSGLFSRKHRVPVDCGNLVREMESIRDLLEREVIAKHGEIGVDHAAIIESVLIHHKRQRLLERWLIRPKHIKPRPWESDDENNTQSIPLADRMKLVSEESKAAEARAKAIQSLGLGKSTSDDIPWAQVFAAGMKVAGVIDAKAKQSSEGE